MLVVLATVSQLWWSSLPFIFSEFRDGFFRVVPCGSLGWLSLEGGHLE